MIHLGPPWIPRLSDSTRVSLLDAIRDEGSEAAWRQFCEIYEELIRQWLRRESLQPADIDDLTQDVLATLVRELKNFSHNGRPGAFRCWLRRLVANRLRRLWQSRSKRPRATGEIDLGSLADELTDDASRLSSIWDLEHDRYVVGELLDSLQPRFSAKNLQAFERVAIHCEDARKVADEMQMSLGAVRVAQHRIAKALRDIAGDLVS